MVVIGKKLNTIANIYEEPCLSSDIGCAFVSNLSDKYYVWPISDIKYKCQKIPYFKINWLFFHFCMALVKAQ